MSPRWKVLLAGCGVAVAAACAAPVTGTASPGPGTSAPAGTSARPAPRLAPPVRTPLDARGIGVCDLLTPEQLRQLGFEPETAVSKTVGAADNCTWDIAADPGNIGGVQLATDRKIPALDGIYLVRDTFAVFEPLVVAGHPAVHADSNAGSSCTIYTAIADYQAIAVGADTAGRPSPDPCASSIRMTELILSNLPPLR